MGSLRAGDTIVMGSPQRAPGAAVTADDGVPGPTAASLSAAIGLVVSYRPAVPAESLLEGPDPGDVICALVVLADAALNA